MKEGEKYGRLIVVKYVGKGKNCMRRWLFQCDCGNKKIIYESSVKNGLTRSCGCLAREKAKERCVIRLTTHGMTNTSEFRSWTMMQTRCSNKNRSNYKYWGGRGIEVCSRWLGKEGFQNFYKDMGSRLKGETLDRINNDGNYEPSNCRWATQKQQTQNRRLSSLNKKIRRLSEEAGLSLSVIRGRINCGWSERDCKNIPFKKHR